MITDREKFIKIVGILSMSDIHPSDCNYITDYIIELGSILDEVREYITTNTCWDLRTSKVLEILDKVKK